jgi:hypothetical protein
MDLPAVRKQNDSDGLEYRLRHAGSRLHDRLPNPFKDWPAQKLLFYLSKRGTLYRVAATAVWQVSASDPGPSMWAWALPFALVAC